jgi:hypothetical protein
MMVGWGGNAPIIVNLCTNAAARAPLPALAVGAAGACDGASDGVSLLAGSEDPLLGSEDCVSAGASDGVSIGAGGGGGGGGGGAGAGAIGLTGDSGFVGLVTDLVHESPVKFHWPQTA